MDLMIAKMRLLGGLAGYTRQLDVHMGCDADIKRHADAFMRGIAPVMEENREHHA
jgi:pyruvate,water dikinase